MSKMEIGTIACWVVGMPGPDIDICIITGVSDEKYDVLFQVYGQGDFHKSTQTIRNGRIWPASESDRRFYDNLINSAIEKRDSLGLPKIPLKVKND